MIYSPFMKNFNGQSLNFKTLDFIEFLAVHFSNTLMCLYVLAKYGYTLQKSRAKLPFENLSDSIEKNNEYRREMFTKAMLNLNNDNPKSE